MEVQANNAIGAQRSIADLMTGGAAAQAAGKVGAANAWGGMLGGLAGAANQVGGYYQQKKLLSQMGYGAAQGPSPEQLWNMPGPQNPWTTNPNFWYGSPANPTAPGGPPTAMPMSGGYSAAPWSSMTPNYYGGVPSSPGYLGKYGGYRW
jgi:hypothetical protein